MSDLCIPLPSPNLTIWILLGAIVTGRLAWWAHYFWRFRGNIMHGVTATTALLTPAAAKSKERLDQIHKAAIDVANKQFEALVLGGTLALAAWTVLFAAPSDGPASRIGNQTLSLLLIAATVLLSGPLLGRRDGAHLTFMIRDTSTYLGFSAAVLALSSAIADLAGEGWTVAAIILAIAIAARDIIEAGLNIAMNRDLVADPAQITEETA